MRLLFALILLGGTIPPPPTVRVTVRLLDVRADKGGVIHAAFHIAPGDDFPGPSRIGNQDVRPVAPETVMVFDVEPGIYAVAVHHDANANGKVDKNFFGVPREGYAISNDPRARLRPPRFSEAQVAITRDTTLTLHMSY